jgi:hypothetical protein
MLRNVFLALVQKQYSKNDKQKIEDKGLDQVLDEAIEELDDTLAYVAWVRIKVQKLRANLKDVI